MEKNNFRLPPDLRLRPPARRYAGLWVGVVTVAVAAAAFFFEMHLTAAPVEQTLMTAAVMILCCFIMYTSLFDAGRQSAENGEEYRRVTEEYRTVRERVQGGLRELEAFCADYVRRELIESRARLLERAGLSEEAYRRRRSGEMSRQEYRALPRAARRALRRAIGLRPLKLHAAMLMSGGTAARRAPVLSARPARIRRTAAALLPTVLGSLVTVAVTLDGAAMTPAAVIAGILRIFTIVWTGVRGYSAGAYTLTEDECAATESKTVLLRAFLAEGERRGA